jgi:hypothetical protein
VRLTVDGKTLTQPLRVKMDPRIVTSSTGLVLQFKLSMDLYEAMAAHPAEAEDQLRPLYAMLQETDAAPSTQLVAAVKAKLTELAKKPK